MKRISCLFFGCLFISLPLGMCSAPQFVKLEGRQFKYNGYDFYPLVCNYSTQIAYNGSYTNFSNCYLTPCNSYGNGYLSSGGIPLPNFDYDYDTPASALLHLQNDFAQIKAMKFNAIRTAEIGPIKDDFSATGSVGFRIKTYENAHPIWTQTSYDETLSPTPYAYNDPLNVNVQKLFSFYETIFTEAANAGLMVLLDVAYGDLARDNGNIDRDDYKLYLEALADHFKNEQALLAYVIIEEPSFESQGHKNTGHTKQYVCEATTTWYDAIKAKDPNHLITMGGAYVLDVMEWDPGVMKLDFYCPHLYPATLDYESYDVNKAFDRVMGNLIWLEKNSPMPWMIGETGFSAYDDCYYSPLPSYIAPAPGGTNGNLLQQEGYAQNVVDAVRNTGGSGFSWWNYQENWWGPDWVNEDGLGLLRHGPGDITSEKDATQVFRNYTFPLPTTYTTPTNYYDPFNYDLYNPGSPYTYTGIVTEEGTSNNIGDAVIFAYTYFRKSLLDLNIYTALPYTFSQSTGFFTLNTLIPTAYINALAGINYDVANIKISAVGAERENYGWTPTSPLLPPTTPIACSLKISHFNYDLFVVNEIIAPTTLIPNFKGWNTLTVSNTEVLSGANSTFKARSEVQINPEFHAHSGSETHIYCSPSFPDCNDYSDPFFLKVHHEIEDLSSFNTTESEEIELSFTPINTYTYFEAKPNPSEGLFNIKLRTNDKSITQFTIKIFDIRGKLIYSAFKNEFVSTLDLSDNSPGLYFLQVTTENKNIVQKIIIQ